MKYTPTLDDAIATEDDIDTTVEEQPSVTWEHEELAQVRIKVIRGHKDSINSCEYIDNDQKLFTGSSDRTVCFWDTDKGTLLHSHKTEHRDIITEARLDKDAKRFVTSSWDKTVKVCDAETGQCLWTGKHDGMVMCCKFSNDGKMVASGSDLDDTLKVWDAGSGQVIHSLTDIHKSTITSCMFAPDSDKVVTTSMDRTTHFYDLVSCQSTLRLGGHINIVSSCDITPDERKFASASWDKNVQVWDVATGGYRSHGPSVLTGSHEGSISCCKFSTNGLMLVTGSYDQTVVVWDVENQIQKIKLQGHDDWVMDVGISQDEKWLMSCSKDHTVRLWNIEDSDKIPIVMERKKAIGLKILKCEKCGKPFSIAQLEDQSDVTKCVFCRSHTAERTMSTIYNQEKEKTVTSQSKSET